MSDCTTSLPKPCNPRIPFKMRVRFLRDRLRFWPLSMALKLFRWELRNNDYAISWHANIAMPIYDAARGKLTVQDANLIADKLMQHLFQAKAEYPPQVITGCKFP